jgi:hypothetical protein
MDWMNGLKQSFRQGTPRTVTADAVRDKLESLDITEQDIADAVNWAQQDS